MVLKLDGHDALLWTALRNLDGHSEMAKSGRSFEIISLIKILWKFHEIQPIHE